MEESEEFKWAVKVVIKRQMRDLIEQLREKGEEVAIISADLMDGSCSHFGSPKGDWFISEQRNLASSFLNFCRSNEKRKPRQGLSQKVSNSYGQHFVDSDQSSRAVFQDIVSSTGYKQEGSSKTVLRLSVPDHLADGMTDEELAGLVGRLVVSKLTGSLQAGSSPGNTGTLKNKDSIARTRSGRAVSSSFQDVLWSLKKSSARNARDSKTNSVCQLTGVSEDDLTRFEVCTDSGTIVNILCVSVTVQQLEVMSGPIVQALEDFISANKMSDTSQPIKIVVSRDSIGDTVQVKKTLPEENGYSTVSDSYPNMDLDMEVSDREDLEDENVDDPDYKVPIWSKPKHGGSLKNLTIGPSAIAKLCGPPQKALSLRIGIKEKQLRRQNKKKKKRKKAECPHCGITVSDHGNLPSHIRRMHLKIRNHKCSICSKEFFTSSSLETHMIAIHTRQCESCREYVVESIPWGEGIKFNTPRELMCVCGGTVTVVSRIGVKSRKDRQMIDEESNDEDNKIRKKLDPNQKYACGVCGRLYTTKIACERHARCHSSVKNYVCELCGGGFKERQFLTRHKFKEHGIYTNRCEFCNGNFSSELALKVHIGKHHPKPLKSTLPDKTIVESQVAISPVDIDSLITK